MKLVKFSLLCLLMAMSTLVNAACWEKREYREIENFSELDNKLILSFKDAVNCNAIGNATVKLGKLLYETDSNGYVTLPMTAFIEAGNIELPMVISKSGYTTINTRLIVAAGTVLNRRMLLSPSLAGSSMRFILQWSEAPKDLDLHLEGNGFHVSYRNLRAAGEAILDQDTQSGFGPETITLNNVKQHQHYKLSVVNYSGGGNIDETAKVLVYVGDQLNSIIPLNATASRSVDVLEISSGKINKLQSVNTENQSELIPGW
ncbi:MAG: hypothetical protein OEY29_04490 [Gammaproteobacteria bacterium]|nr:hypothetical protein [Gammaproteobacteria bacterium]